MWVNEIYRSFGSRCKSRVIVNHGLVVVVGIDCCKQRRYGRHDEDKELGRKKGQEADRTAFKRRHHATSTSSEVQSRLHSSKPSASASTSTLRKQDNEGSPRLTVSTRWDYTCFLNTPLSPPRRRQSVGKRDIP